VPAYAPPRGHVAQRSTHNCQVSSRYSLTLRIDFTAGDDPAARAAFRRNLDVLDAQASALRESFGETRAHGDRTAVQVKLQRLNDDAPPRMLVVETL
jgi:hypothetical protein